MGSKISIKITIITFFIVLLGFIFYDSNYGDKVVYNLVSGLNSENSYNNQAIENQGNNAKEESVADTETNKDSKTSTNNVINSGIRLEEEGKSVFVPYNDSILHFTRDGAKFYRSINSMAWNDSYSVSSPTVVTEGGYSALFDIPGKTARVYNESGLVYGFMTEESITGGSVNENGNLALILNGKNEYYVQVYNGNGELKFQRFDQEIGVFPMCAEISKDNGVVAIAYTDTRDIELKSKVLFFYTNKKDANSNVGGDMFGAHDGIDEIIFSITNITGDSYICISDKRVFCIGTDGKVIWETKLGNKIDFYSVSQSGNIGLALGEEIPSSESIEPNTVLFLNSLGKKTGEFECDSTITSLLCNEFYSVIGEGNTYTGVRYDGNTVWSHLAPTEVNSIIPIDKSGTVIYSTNNLANITTL